MKALKHLGLAALIGLTSTLSLTAVAQGMDPSKMGGTAASAEADMTDGEIRKVDKDNKKLTIKHGDIKNLDMPGMTMVFQLRDPAMVEQVKVGDKIRFKVEKTGSGFVVTELQPTGK
jgi:Cu(I)/Ag(I) efflux system protein CusF